MNISKIAIYDRYKSLVMFIEVNDDFPSVLQSKVRKPFDQALLTLFGKELRRITSTTLASHTCYLYV